MTVEPDRAQHSSPFLVATTIAEAVTAMANGAKPIAGGTDLVVLARQGKVPLPTSLVAIDRIPELSAISLDHDRINIGAAVTHATLMADRTVVAELTGLADGAALVGSPATRHVGTIGGNVMNGSPAMDTGAPLMVLGASVELRSATSTRIVPVGELWSGPGTTTAEANELCTAVTVPVRPARSGSAYVRLEYRRAMEIAVVGAAAAVTLDDDGRVAALSVALTAVGPTIMAVIGLEPLVGRVVDKRMLDAVRTAASDQAKPISDLRAGIRYRRHTVGVMAERALAAAAARASGDRVTVPVNRATGIGAAT